MINTYLGLLSLQVAVATLGAVFISLGAIIAITNFTDINLPTGSIPINYIFVGVFIGLLLISGVLMIMAAYYESQKFCLYSIAMIAFILILFVGGAIISFLNEPSMMKNVCISERCTVSLWLMGSKDTTHEVKTDKTEENESKPTTEWRMTVLVREDYTSAATTTPKPETEETDPPTNTKTVPKNETNNRGSNWKPNSNRSQLGKPLSHKAEKGVPPKRLHGREITKNHFGIQNNSQMLQSTQNNDPVKVSVYLNMNLERIPSGENTYERSIMFRPKKSHPKNEEHNYGDKDEDKAENMEHEDEKSFRSTSEIPGLTLAIVLCVTNIVFFLTTVIVIWSYQKELQVIGNFADKYGLKRYE